MRRLTPLLTESLQWLVIVLACLMAVSRPARGTSAAGMATGSAILDRP